MKATFRAVSVHSITGGSTAKTSEVVSFAGVAEAGQTSVSSKKSSVAGTFSLTVTDATMYGFFQPGTDYDFTFSKATKPAVSAAPAPAKPATPAAPVIKLPTPHPAPVIAK